MEFDLDQRTVSLSIGEFSSFSIGPREAGDGSGNQGIWRAQLGTRWHQELRSRTTSSTPGSSFEVPVSGRVFHAGWTLSLTGRIDQFLPATANGPATLREIKTVLSTLPASEEDLRAEHPSYFAQLATYLALRHIADPAERIRGELVFVEAGSGLIQTVVFTSTDEGPFRVQLERVAEFLNLRLRARERLRSLTFRPAFTELREGQQSTQTDLAAALARRPQVLFVAPTGFGKTGALLECALTHMKAGKYSRMLYLTSKATGQLQVMRTLQAMTRETEGGTAIAAWHVRPKHEHCLSPTCFCQRREFNHPESVANRWSRSGLSRFYLLENHARDIETLRLAGRDAQICPYEITRTALAFQDVWIGDYNYVFAPANRSLFYNQPGFNPAETLLVIDEAHNLPARAADARSHTINAENARQILAELDHLRAPSALSRAWESWALLLSSIDPCEALDLTLEDDLVDALRVLADTLANAPLDYSEIELPVLEALWQIPVLADWFTQSFPRLVWSPRAGELRLTCLDAAKPTGEILREYGGVIFATATPGPAAVFAEACGLTVATSQLTTPDAPLAAVTAHTPWRDDAYDIAYDVRVDTTFQQRARYYAATANTIATLHAAANGPVAVFFPSYAYAEAIERALQSAHPGMRASLQPRLSDLAAQSAWVAESLAFSDALFLVLGSSFAEGIDTLGGHITHAMVVGPALPEVNAVQKARVDALAGHTREQSFQRVYQIPGIQKVNQALGRLVRAPGQHAKVILQCRRFIEPAYASLLDRDYQFGATIVTEAQLKTWLAEPHPST
ncbi:MAG: helicase C-terminal domain-containing protein [Rariglobus sp.]